MEDVFFVCVCVLFLNTRLGKQRFVFIGTPAKVPKSILCPQPCRLKYTGRIDRPEVPILQANYFFCVGLFCNIPENYFSNLLSSCGKC